MLSVQILYELPSNNCCQSFHPNWNDLLRIFHVIQGFLRTSSQSTVFRHMKAPGTYIFLNPPLGKLMEKPSLEPVWNPAEISKLGYQAPGFADSQ